VVLEFDRVSATDLVKLYGATRALAGVSLSFSAGEVCAVEGPNGSGKTTLLTLLSLMARPTRGQIRFGSHDALSTPALRGRIGVLAHSAMVYPDLNGAENLELFAQLYGLSDRAQRIGALRERFELGAFFERPARTYSRGQLQRLSLARALLHGPQLLLLDEPSTGLDTRAVEHLIEAVKAERARGAIVVLVTHDPQLSTALADRRVLLKSGRLLEAEAAA
jgi:heme exporter protein A